LATAGVVGVDRVPPQSLEAEQSTLGSMLLDKEAIATAAEILVAEDFYRDAHRTIFDALISLFNKGEPADLITVTEALRQRNAIDAVGGASYISTLANTVPTSANCEYYAKIVKNRSIMRALVTAGSQIASIDYDSEEQLEWLNPVAGTELGTYGDARVYHSLASEPGFTRRNDILEARSTDDADDIIVYKIEHEGKAWW
jgi:replicative DNA helicase